MTRQGPNVLAALHARPDGATVRQLAVATRITPGTVRRWLAAYAATGWVTVTEPAIGNRPARWAFTSPDLAEARPPGVQEHGVP